MSTELSRLVISACLNELLDGFDELMLVHGLRQDRHLHVDSAGDAAIEGEQRYGEPPPHRASRKARIRATTSAAAASTASRRATASRRSASAACRRWSSPAMVVSAASSAAIRSSTASVSAASHAGMVSVTSQDHRCTSPSMTGHEILAAFEAVIVPM